jgi:hypothetical protein
MIDTEYMQKILSENKIFIKVILPTISTWSLPMTKNPILCEPSYAFTMDQYKRSGLDVLFYGQEHFDTLAIL